MQEILIRLRLPTPLFFRRLCFMAFGWAVLAIGVLKFTPEGILTKEMTTGLHYVVCAGIVAAFIARLPVDWNRAATGKLSDVADVEKLLGASVAPDLSLSAVPPSAESGAPAAPTA